MRILFGKQIELNDKWPCEDFQEPFSFKSKLYHSALWYNSDDDVTQGSKLIEKGKQNYFKRS